MLRACDLFPSASNRARSFTLTLTLSLVREGEGIGIISQALRAGRCRWPGQRRPGLRGEHRLKEGQDLMTSGEDWGVVRGDQQVLKPNKRPMLAAAPTTRGRLCAGPARLGRARAPFGCVLSGPDPHGNARHSQALRSDSICRRPTGIPRWRTRELIAPGHLGQHTSYSCRSRLLHYLNLQIGEPPADTCRSPGETR